MGDSHQLPLPQPNPSSTASMSPPNSPQIDQPKLESEPAQHPETPIEESRDPSKKAAADPAEEANSDEEGEEEGECGFCLFMKAGGCRETFTDWEKCVEEGEKNKEDIVEKCFQVTSALRKCMEAHSDYYAPLLEAEEAAAKQLEAEKERSGDQAAGGEELDGSVKAAVA